MLLLHGLEGVERVALRLGVARGLPAPRMARRGDALPGLRRRAESARTVLPLGGDRRPRLGRRGDRKTLPEPSSLRGRRLARWKRAAQVARGARLRGAPSPGPPRYPSPSISAGAPTESNGGSQRSTGDISLERCTGRSARSSAPGDESPIDLSRLSGWRTFREFDENVTSPLHGFDGAEDYYRRASSGPFVARIRIPTLIVQAENDPFVPGSVLPAPSPSVRLEASSHGGHAGFVAGAVPGRPRYWLEERIPAFFEEVRRLRRRRPRPSC